MNGARASLRILHLHSSFAPGGKELRAAKLMNLFTSDKINPLVGAAGVSAVPMAARVAHKMGAEADKKNYLLMFAMGPNLSGVIGTVIAAVVLG